MLHPKAARGAQGATLAAFNTVDERGLRHYRAAVSFLAKRYSDPAKPHGWLSIGDQELFAHRKPKPDYEPHEVDLTAWAGKTIDLALASNPLGNSASDHAAWVKPRILRLP